MRKEKRKRATIILSPKKLSHEVNMANLCKSCVTRNNVNLCCGREERNNFQPEKRERETEDVEKYAVAAAAAVGGG